MSYSHRIRSRVEHELALSYFVASAVALTIREGARAAAVRALYGAWRVSAEVAAFRAELERVRGYVGV